ncbi:hypothetical protein KR009_001806 [Drosophila setifemur]|nr:hypothetical protein KR009_001806 [Drosophila setifemur]
MKPVSAKMVDSLTRRHLLAALLMALGICLCLGGTKESASDTKWMAPLKQYGYTAEHLKNKVEHGEFTTFELGTPNYRILNPEDEPEYITADQPHYQEMLRRLTSAQSNADTIDVEMAGRADTVRVAPEQNKYPTTPRVSEATKPPTRLGPIRWEKLKKRSFFQRGQKDKKTTNAEAADHRSFLANIQVYEGARPFQSRVANLN